MSFHRYTVFLPKLFEGKNKSGIVFSNVEKSISEVLKDHKEKDNLEIPSAKRSSWLLPGGNECR
jgi:hypothetical protein